MQNAQQAQGIDLNKTLHRSNQTADKIESKGEKMLKAPETHVSQ